MDQQAAQGRAGLQAAEGGDKEGNVLRVQRAKGHLADKQFDPENAGQVEQRGSDERSGRGMGGGGAR